MRQMICVFEPKTSGDYDAVIQCVRNEIDFARPIIDAIEGLRCRMPSVGFQDVAKRLLCGV